MRPYIYRASYGSKSFEKVINRQRRRQIATVKQSEYLLHKLLYLLTKTYDEIIRLNRAVCLHHVV